MGEVWGARGAGNAPCLGLGSLPWRVLEAQALLLPPDCVPSLLELCTGHGSGLSVPGMEGSVVW